MENQNNKKMKSLIEYCLILFLLIATLASCDKEDNPIQKNPCEFLAQLDTFDLDINGNELIVSISLQENFSFSEIDSIGITYQIEGQDQQVEIKYEIEPNVTDFKLRLNQNLICGFRYEFNFFIGRSSERCNSKVFYFDSPTSSIKSPWCFNANPIESGYNNLFGIAIGNKKFVIFQNGSFFEVDPIESTLIPKKSFPILGNTGIHFTLFSEGKFGYFKSTQSEDLYRYDSANDTWMNYGIFDISTMYLNKYQSEMVDGNVYVFNSAFTYKFDIETKSLEKLAEHEENELMLSFKVKNNIYAITEYYNILRLNINTGSWTKISEYPGQKSDKIVAFVNNEKAYIGLSFRYNAPGMLTYLDLYELNVETLEWRQLKDFTPSIENVWNIGTVYTTDESYIIYRGLSTGFPAIVWKFNPNDIVYK